MKFTVKKMETVATTAAADPVVPWKEAKAQCL